jgi:hypothetical protein
MEAGKRTRFARANVRAFCAHATNARVSRVPPKARASRVPKITRVLRTHPQRTRSLKFSLKFSLQRELTSLDNRIHRIQYFIINSFKF